MTTDSEHLVQSASRGDPAAIEALLERDLPRLRAFLRRLESAFDRLAGDHREVLALARIVGLPHACRALLHRATAQLGMILAEMDGDAAR